jgi:hypothetical protein
MSQQAVSADIIQNSDVGNFSPKTEGSKTKTDRFLFFMMSSLPVHFEFFTIFSYCLLFAKFVCLLCHYSRRHTHTHTTGVLTERVFKYILNIEYDIQNIENK